MAKRKTPPKTVDLEDLQPSDPLEGRNDDIVDIVVPGLSVQDLDKLGKTPPTKLPDKNAKKPELVVDANARGNSPRKAKDQLEHMTSKLRFDRRKLNVYGLGSIALVFAIGFACNHSVSFEAFLEARGIAEASTQRLPRYIFEGIRLFGKYYPLLCVAMAFSIPLKLQSSGMFEIFYEGVYAPVDLGSKPVLRKRIPWEQIAELNFLRKDNIPLTELLDKDGQVMGQLRLDVDHPEGMIRAIDKYAPKTHPLRRLLGKS